MLYYFNFVVFPYRFYRMIIIIFIVFVSHIDSTPAGFVSSIGVGTSFFLFIPCRWILTVCTCRSSIIQLKCFVCFKFNFIVVIFVAIFFSVRHYIGSHRKLAFRFIITIESLVIGLKLTAVSSE